MPQLLDDALAQQWYKTGRPKINGVGGDLLTYSRELVDPPHSHNRFVKRRDWLTGFGLDNNAQILVIGCGFGYLIEYLIGAGISDVWGIEGGPFFWDPANDGEWDPAIKSRVANDWIGSGTEQASLDALPGVPNNERFTFIVDEDAATCHSDAELPAFIAACEARLQGNVKGRIIHLVSPTPSSGPGHPFVNWKTMAEWKAVAPDHTWVNIGSGEVEP